MILSFQTYNTCNIVMILSFRTYNTCNTVMILSFRTYNTCNIVMILSFRTYNTCNIVMILSFRTFNTCNIVMIQSFRTYNTCNIVMIPSFRTYNTCNIVMILSFRTYNTCNIVMILSFRTYKSGQTVQTQIRLLIKVYSLQFRLHLLDVLLYGKASLFNFRVTTVNFGVSEFLGVLRYLLYPNFHDSSLASEAEQTGFEYCLVTHPKAGFLMKWLIWAMLWENLFMSYANNKVADQPAYTHSLINTFVVHCLDSIISLVSIFAIYV